MYLKTTDVNTFADIPDDMRQIFEHEFKKSVYKNEIIKRKHDGLFTDEDVAIAKMLLDYRFVTLNQLYEAVSTDESIVKFKKRMDQLVKFRIINRFALSFDTGLKRIPDDAFLVYCLDVGGHHLLTHFSEGEKLLDWFYIINMVTSEIVARDLMIAEIGRAFLANKPAGLTYFEPKTEIKVGRKTMIPAFEFLLETHGQRKYFVGEIMRSNDAPTLFRDKAMKWNQLLKTETWRKYYGGSDAGSPPILLLLASDDETALSAARILDETGEIDLFRLTTEARSHKALYEKGAFLKYNKTDKILNPTGISNFKPEEEEPPPPYPAPTPDETEIKEA